MARHYQGKEDLRPQSPPLLHSQGPPSPSREKTVGTCGEMDQRDTDPGLPLPPLAESGLNLHVGDDGRLLPVEGGEHVMEALGPGRLGGTREPSIPHAVSPVTQQNKPSSRHC